MDETIEKDGITYRFAGSRQTQGRANQRCKRLRAQGKLTTTKKVGDREILIYAANTPVE